MSYLYTSIPVSRNVSTSQEFLDNKNPNEMACPVGISNINPLPATGRLSYSAVKDNLGSAAAAVILNKPVTLGISEAALGQQAFTVNYFQPPPMVTSFSGRDLSEQVQAEMSTLGFRKEVSGSSRYYKGPPSEAAVRKIVSLGGETDTYAPYGASSIQGFMAFTAISSLLCAAMSAIATPLSATNYLTNYDEDSENNVSFKPEAHGFHQEAAKAKLPGIFMPFFDKLTLPDKDFPAQYIIEHFSLAFGKTIEDRLRAASTIREGWRSVATSGPGLALAHAIYGLKTALAAGGKPVIITQNGSYVGTLIQGKQLYVLKGGVTYKSLSSSHMLECITALNLHDANLTKIAGIITSNADKTVSAEEISSPRRLHEALRRVTLTTDQMNECRTLIGSLKFNSPLWDLSNDEHLLAAFQALISRDFLPPQSPMIIRGDAIFTKDPILSTLAAFGVRAPSMIGLGTTLSIVVNKTNTYSEKMGAHRFRGVPIFFKPLQEAFDDWKRLTAHSSITLRVGGLDNRGYSKIPGVSKYWEFGESHTKTFQGMLGKLAQSEKTREKRKREKEQKEDANPEADAARAKRIKSVKDGHSSVHSLFFQASTSGLMEVDNEDEEMS